MPSVNINELVVSVRESLEAADTTSRQAGKPPLFALDSFELELKFVAQESDVVKGGVDIKIVSFGAQSNVKTEQIQTLKVKYSVARDAVAKGTLGSRAHGTTSTAATQDVSPL